MTVIISNSSIKCWKNSSLFPILRISILQIASDLTVFTKDVFDISFVNGLGLTSTFPIISANSRNTISMFGFTLCKAVSEATRIVFCVLFF